MNDSIGGLWLKSSANPKAPFAGGEITLEGKKYKIVVWKNQYKEAGDNKPDFRINIDVGTRSGQPMPPTTVPFADDVPF